MSDCQASEVMMRQGEQMPQGERARVEPYAPPRDAKVGYPAALKTATRIAYAMTLLAASFSLSGCAKQAETPAPEPTARLMSGLTIVNPALDGLLTSVSQVNQQLADDAVITIYCESSHVQCHYPDGYNRDQWGCVDHFDTNEDGLWDKDSVTYGAEAEAKLIPCLRGN
jgi:hypothetical protein